MWSIFLSIRYFLSKRKEGMISLIGGVSVVGVALGIASLIIVLSVMNGFDREVKDKIVGAYAHILIFREGGITDHEELLARLGSMPEVESASVFVNGQAVLRKDRSVTGVLLRGVDPSAASEAARMEEYFSAPAGDLKGDTIIIGSELMSGEGISVGDTVEVLVPYSAADMEKSRLRVVGGFTSGRYDYDANMAVVGIDTARRIFRTGDAVGGIALRVDDEMAVDSLRTRLQSMLGYPYIVKSWMDLDRNLVTALALEKKMMFVILALIIMVACFNISSSLIMMVMEKTRDIGILKAIGANSRGVSSVFMTQGAMIGAAGIVLGALSGVFLANRINYFAGLLERVTGITVFPNDIYYFTEIPVNVSVTDVCAVITTAMALTIAAGIYPAWKASRLDPVEAIRYE